jgi:thiamine monophosphate kinase
MDKLSVAVIGLLPRQAERVSALYGEDLELRFIQTDTAMQKIRATVESTDHVLIMTKFTPHDIQDGLRKRGKMEFCNGGTSSVGQKLDELLGR